MGLLLPPQVVRDIRGNRAADMERAERTALCAEFTAELRCIDPALEMVYWPMRAPRTHGFVRGAYHILRHPVNGSSALVEALTDDAGNPREPGSWVFDKLRAADMWNDEAMADRRRLIQRAKDAESSRRAREDEDRREELHDRFNAACRTQISTHKPASGWTQVAGAPKAKAAE